MSETTFEHQAGIYGSDREFLEMALPFLESGLSNGEPVLAVTTPANLELISSALGERGGDVDYAESAFFGRPAATAGGRLPPLLEAAC